MKTVTLWVLCVALLVCGLFASGEILHDANSLCPQREAIQVYPEDPEYQTKPNIDGAKSFINGEIRDYKGTTVDVTSPIFDATTNQRTVIGRLAQMTEDDLHPILESSKEAWYNGQGTWPQMSPEERISAIELVVASLRSRRDIIVKTLMWEICKSFDDAQAEFDRTMNFIEASIAAYRSMDIQEGNWQSVGGIYAKIRRLAIGIVLCLGPYNYPFNETYATLIPALLMGNIVIMKLPTLGGLTHILTMEAYAEHLPPGTLNFVSGSGRRLLPPIMKSGVVDVLAFIGGSKAADELIALHPHPHRLKVFLQLEGKNLGIVLPDADLQVAAEQMLIGTTSYNGQRCTAIKLLMLHEAIATSFLDLFVPLVRSLRFGLPWQSGGVNITHLPPVHKVQYLTHLVSDAVEKGASVIQDRCEVYGESLMLPTMVLGVTPEMRLWHEEQFGPVIPIAVFNDTKDILSILRQTPYGQQAAVFTSYKDTSDEDTQTGHTNADRDTVQLLDALALSVGRVNINTQCGRSPDVLPFSGRRSSALGTMSVNEALRTFSVELLVAGKENTKNKHVMQALVQDSQVMQAMKEDHHELNHHKNEEQSGKREDL